MYPSGGIFQARANDRKDTRCADTEPHMWMCGAMVLVALVFVLATGSALPLLPVIGCVLMMGAMMFMMGGMGRRGGDGR